MCKQSSVGFSGQDPNRSITAQPKAVRNVKMRASIACKPTTSQVISGKVSPRATPMSPLGSNHAATRPKVASTQHEESEGVFASIPRQILLESMHKVDGNRYSVVIEAIKTKCVIKCTRQSVTQRLELSFRQAL